MLLVTDVAPRLTSQRAKEYLNHGVSRRLQLIKRCLENIFSIFPPARTMRLTTVERNEVEIQLHAFVINVYGLQDNLAWVYVHEKGLEHAIKGGRRGVGLFNRNTQCHLPQQLQAYLGEERMVKWHDMYAKNYRDALAHRIPLYVPPSIIRPDDEAKYQDLEKRSWERLLAGDVDGSEALKAEQNELQRICYWFVHSYGDTDKAPPMQLHAQVICDAKTVIEMINVVRKHLA